MKNKKIIIFLLMILIPINVHAYSINCGTGKYSYGDEFTCYIDGIDETKTYESLSGTYTIPDSLTCSLQKANCGFNGGANEKEFNLNKGDLIIITGGFPLGESKKTNYLKIIEI